jgi:UPF0755 protein
MRRAVVALVLLCALAGAGWAGWGALERSMDEPGGNAVPVRIQIQPGMPLRAILADLHQRGVLRHVRMLELHLRLHRERPRAQAGIYEIAAHASARQILEQLVQGRVLLESVTIVEGWDFAQMRQALDAQPDIVHQLRGLTEPQVMQALGHPGESAEGRFFPDTYLFAAGTPDRKILELAYRRMQSLLQADWTQRDVDLPLSSPDQALTLASIIEKESARPDERPKIAAVFLNRLRRGMRLQADPTVIYGLGARYDGSIHTRDLESDTPYNTYTRTGLPPTPIALPSAAALQAALHPARIEALYFVATGEGDGSHHFSDTLAEHDEALRAYLHRLAVGTARRAAGATPPSAGSGAAGARVSGSNR